MSDAEAHLTVGEGLKSFLQFHRFVNHIDPISLDHLDTLLNTTNQDILNYIGKSRFVAKKLREAIVRFTDPWQPESLGRLLMVLNHVPFELNNLIENELGHAVKSIKKTAITLNNEKIVNETTHLIKIWKEMQSKQTSGKRDSPERSSSDSPPSEGKKIKLAIQKDPPARPKAMTDPNFFTSSLGGPADVKYRTVRPVYSTGPLKEDEATTTALVSRPPLPTKKSVTFAEKLFEIREYEKNPEEWTSFDNPPEPYYNIPIVTWYPPYELTFNTDENPNLVIPKQVRTVETAAQDSREKMALAAIYTSAQHIPSSPGEPDEVPDKNTDTRPIPLVDVNTVYTTTDSPAVASQTINPNMMTPANLNAAAAIAAAMDPFLIPTQQQQYQPPPPPQPQQQQPEISSHTVEAMLKNNPGIMQSLKQLSFLAAGTTTPATAPVTYQPPAVQTHQPQNYSNEAYSRDNRNRQQQQKMRGGRGRGRGTSRGGGGPTRNVSRSCNYYSSPEGCRNGSNCPFLHE